MTTDSTDKQIRRALLRLETGLGRQFIIVGGEKFYITTESHFEISRSPRYRIEHVDIDGIPWTKWAMREDLKADDPDGMRDYCNEILTEVLLDR